MVSGSLALLYFSRFHGGKQGSSPDKGQSLVEWGDFLYVRLFVCLSVPPCGPSSLRPSQSGLAGWASGLVGWASGLAGWASGLAGWTSGLAGWTLGLAGWTSGLAG